MPARNPMTCTVVLPLLLKFRVGSAVRRLAGQWVWERRTILSIFRLTRAKRYAW